MSTSASIARLLQLSAISLVIGGFLGALAAGFHPGDLVDPANVPTHPAM